MGGDVDDISPTLSNTQTTNESEYSQTTPKVFLIQLCICSISEAHSFEVNCSLNYSIVVGLSMCPRHNPEPTSEAISGPG